jgi:hypothetical protein
VHSMNTSRVLSEICGEGGGRARSQQAGSCPSAAWLCSCALAAARREMLHAVAASPWVRLLVCCRLTDTFHVTRGHLDVSACPTAECAPLMIGGSDSTVRLAS